MLNTNRLPLDDWFASIAPVQKPPHEIVVNDLLSRFGIKSALDMVKYMQSPEGKITQACVNQSVQREMGEKEIAQWLLQLELRRKQHLAYFILSLKHDKEKARQHLRNMINEEQQYEYLHSHKKPEATSSLHLSPTYITIEETLLHYDMARNALLEEMSFTVSETDLLERELQSLEASIALLFTRKRFQQEFYTEFHTLAENETINAAYIDTKINAFIHAYQQEIIMLQNMHSDPLNDSFIKHWNLLDQYQLQVNTWHDFRNTLKPGQSIVQKNGVLYLVNNGMTFEELSLEARDKAAHAYLTLRPKLEKTRLKSEDDNEIEHAALEERKKDLMLRINFEKEKINLFQSQMSSLDASITALSAMRANTQADESGRLESTLQLRPVPRPSFTKIQQPASATTKARAALPDNIAPQRPSPSMQSQLMLKLEMCKLRCEQPHPHSLTAKELSTLAAIERSKLIEEIKARPKELIPGAQASPSLLSMLIALNKTPLNIQRRVNNLPEQQLENDKLTPNTAPRPSPFRKLNEQG